MLARGSLWASSHRSPEGAVIRLSSTVVIVNVKKIPVSRRVSVCQNIPEAESR